MTMPASVISLDEAASKIQSGQSLIVGGFGLTGYATSLLEAVSKTDVRDLTYISNNVGEPGLGGGLMLRNGQIRKAIGSFFTSNREVVKAYQAGEIDVQLIPQGDLAEALRAGGAGLGGYFTPTAAGTMLAEGRETRVINGREMVFVEPIRADDSVVLPRLFLPPRQSPDLPPWRQPD